MIHRLASNAALVPILFGCSWIRHGYNLVRSITSSAKRGTSALATRHCTSTDGSYCLVEDAHQMLVARHTCFVPNVSLVLILCGLSSWIRQAGQGNKSARSKKDRLLNEPRLLGLLTSKRKQTTSVSCRRRSAKPCCSVLDWTWHVFGRESNSSSGMDEVRTTNAL